MILWRRTFKGFLINKFTFLSRKNPRPINREGWACPTGMISRWVRV